METYSRAGQITYLLTYLLTPWCRVLLENLTGLQLVKKFPAFHGTRRFITALTIVRHFSLSWASPIQSIYPHPTSWSSVLILSTHLRLGLPSGLLLYSFPSKNLYTPSPHPYVPHVQPLNISLYLSLRVPGKGAPSRSLYRVPMGSDTPSPKPLVTSHSFVHSCMSAGVTKKEPFFTWHKNIKSPSMGAPRWRKAYIEWGAAWFTKGIVTTQLSLPQFHAGSKG